jgi:superfamily II DNA or RNA helicase
MTATYSPGLYLQKIGRIHRDGTFTEFVPATTPTVKEIEQQAARVTKASERQRAEYDRCLALPRGLARALALEAFETAKSEMYAEAAKLFELTRARRRSLAE